MGREGMRAGDRDRQAVADQLKQALDEGRLDLSEYDERLQKTYGAKTFADLDGLLDDLPGTVPPQHSQVQPAASPAAAPVPPGQPDRMSGSRIARWVGPYAGVILFCTLIWAVTSVSAGHLTYYWPFWVLIPMAFGVLGQWNSRNWGSANEERRAARDAYRSERRSRRNY